MELENVLIVAVVLPVLAWLCLTTIQHGKRLIVMGKTQDEMNINLEELKKSFYKMENKLDMFLVNELDTLKELSKNTAEAMKSLTNHKTSKFRS